MRLTDRAHRYAWDTTCNIYNRHDGILNELQLKTYDLLRAAWLAGANRNKK